MERRKQTLRSVPVGCLGTEAYVGIPHYDISKSLDERTDAVVKPLRHRVHTKGELGKKASLQVNS